MDERTKRRFFRHVRRQRFTGCWLWVGPIAGGIYGGFTPAPGQHTYAHRFAYEQLRGPIPANLEIDHLCRNTRCVNPAHLEPVTHQENLRRGRQPSTDYRIVLRRRVVGY